jgi:prepilin peptidase CpaA
MFLRVASVGTFSTECRLIATCVGKGCGLSETPPPEFAVGSTGVFKGQVFIYVLNEKGCMIETVLLTAAFLLLVVGAYTDIRTREVPDWVNMSGIVIGIGVRAVYGVTEHDWHALGWGLLGFIVFFALAIIMYYSGQWGGGDSKLLMAMGALLGLEFSLKGFGLAFLLWVIVAGAGYGLVWSIALAFAHWKDFVSSFVAIERPLSRMRWPMLGVLVLGFAFGIATNDQFVRVLMLVLGIVIPVLFYSAICVKAVEKCCMYKILPAEKLTEGDWIAKTVKAKGKYICGPKDLGITKEQIKLLKKMKVKEVLVREGVPFVPSFLIAFLLALWIGSPLVWFI